MNDRLQELTEKIFKEGIEKGQTEGIKIVAEAKAEADQLVAKARKEAEQIIAAANKNAAAIQENTQSEIKLASRQAIDSVKLELVNLINGQITSSEIKSAIGDSKFVQKLIEQMIINWASQPGNEIDIDVLIPEKDRQSTDQYFASVAKGVLDKGFTIESVNGIKSGFQVSPGDGGYKISFTDQDFVRFFQEFLRPSVVALLFKEKNTEEAV